MTGPEHYQEAERLLADAKLESVDSFVDDIVLAAQVHATLALAAATATSVDMLHADQIAWERVSGAVLDIDGQQR